MRLSQLFSIFYVALCLFSTFVFADGDVQIIDWNDLLAPVEPYEDPFLALSTNQLVDLSTIAQIRKRMKKDNNIPQYILDEMETKHQLLHQQGIDVDSLLAQREAIKAKRKAAAVSTNGLLDGRKIRIAGYLLPLDFDGELITEFLLVPYIGACIHVPPPPPNQIVHVTLQSGYRHEGLYSPVLVEGRIHIGKIERDLFLVDGSSNIPMSYSLLAENIEPYDP